MSGSGLLRLIVPPTLGVITGKVIHYYKSAHPENRRRDEVKKAK